jgi:hypothetical protein
MGKTEFLIISDNSYDGREVHYCDNEEELTRLLNAKTFGRYDWNIPDIEVFKISSELNNEQLTTIKRKSK